MTPERKAQLEAELDEFFRLNPIEPTPLPPPRRKPPSQVRALPKPTIVAEAGVIIADADVVVSPLDPNASQPQPKLVRVRRPDWVTINMDEYARQRAEREWNEAQAQQQRQSLRESDCMNIWGTHNDD
jgi:hypothetical protein